MGAATRSTVGFFPFHHGTKNAVLGGQHDGKMGVTVKAHHVGVSEKKTPQKDLWRTESRKRLTWPKAAEALARIGPVLLAKMSPS